MVQRHPPQERPHASPAVVVDTSQLCLAALRVTAGRVHLPSARDQHRVAWCVLDDGRLRVALGPLRADVDEQMRSLPARLPSTELLAALQHRDGPRPLLVASLRSDAARTHIEWASRDLPPPVVNGPHARMPAPAGDAGGDAGRAELLSGAVLVLRSGTRPEHRAPSPVPGWASAADDQALCSAAVGADLGQDGPYRAVLVLRHLADSSAGTGPHEPLSTTVHDPVLTVRALHDQGTGLPGAALALDRLRLAGAALGRASGGLLLVAVALPRPTVRLDAAPAVARRLLGCFRPGDTVARWAPDLLLGVCNGMDGLDGAHALLGRVVQAARAIAPDARVAALALWDPLPVQELDQLPAQVAWLAAATGHTPEVVQVSQAQPVAADSQETGARGRSGAVGAEASRWA